MLTKNSVTVNIKTLLLSVAAFSAASGALAADYYVTPEGAGEKDGSSWENAFDTEAFRLKALANEDGSVYHLASGTYHPTACILFKKATCATVLGSTEGERTVISGDSDGNGYATSGDQSRLMRFQTNTGNGVTTNPVTISHVDFTCCYTQINEDNTNDATETGVAGVGALYLDNCGWVNVDDCHFYGNWAQGELGGAALHIRRSQAKFTDCVFSGNSANYRGGAVRITSDKAVKGNVTFDRCTFTNNTNYHQFGGAIFMSHGAQLNIVGCTLTGNKAATSGAAIYANSSYGHPVRLRIVNSTIAGNVITGQEADGQIASTQYANIRLMNSIIVTDAENTADFHFKDTDVKEPFSFISSGYNVVGTLTDLASAPQAAPAREEAEQTAPKHAWHDTDIVDAENDFTTHFGQNGVDNGMLTPVKFTAGANAAQLTQGTADWGLPSNVNVTLGHDGTPRAEGQMPGAYALTQDEVEQSTSAITAVANPADGKFERTGVCTYRAPQCGITVYSMTGVIVAQSATDTIDLDALPRGIYLLRSAQTTAKVIK